VVVAEWIRSKGLPMGPLPDRRPQDGASPPEAELRTFEDPAPERDDGGLERGREGEGELTARPARSLTPTAC